MSRGSVCTAGSAFRSGPRITARAASTAPRQACPRKPPLHRYGPSSVTRNKVCSMAGNQVCAHAVTGPSQGRAAAPARQPITAHRPSRKRPPPVMVSAPPRVTPVSPAAVPNTAAPRMVPPCRGSTVSRSTSMTASQPRKAVSMAPRPRAYSVARSMPRLRRAMEALTRCLSPRPMPWAAMPSSSPATPPAMISVMQRAPFP